MKIIIDLCDLLLSTLSRFTQQIGDFDAFCGKLRNFNVSEVVKAHNAAIRIISYFQVFWDRYILNEMLYSLTDPYQHSGGCQEVK